MTTLNFRATPYATFFAVLVALPLGACNDTSALASSGTSGLAAAASQTSTRTPAAGCNNEDFNRFLARFEDDVSVQKNAVVDPLESSTVDANAEPEPKAVTNKLPLASVHFPVMPGRIKQTRDGLVAKRVETNPTQITVQLTKPDTDYQMSFHFRNDGCWRLYRIEDESL